MDLVLVRHGQSGNNLLWHRTGSSRGRSPDPELTELGHVQARAVAQALADNEFAVTPTHLYTSLLTRAVQTADPIAAALDLPAIGHEQIFEYYGPVVMDPDDEQRLTPHPGASRDELAGLCDRLVLPDSATEAGWWRGPVEDREICAERARGVVRQVVAEHHEDDVVVLVTHGTFTQYLIRAVLGVESMTGWLAIDNTGVSRFRFLDGVTVASWINRTTHLSPDQLSD